MFEKSKAKNALSYLGEIGELSREEMIKKAASLRDEDPETAFYVYSYLYYSGLDIPSAINLSTFCAYLETHPEVMVNPEFPTYDGAMRDSVKKLEKAYIYDEFSREVEFSALAQGLAHLGDVGKAIGVVHNTPDGLRSTGARYIKAILAYLDGNDEEDLSFYGELSGEARYALEYAYALQNNGDIACFKDIALGTEDDILLLESFKRLNEAEDYATVAKRAESMIDREVNHLTYYEIIFALAKTGNQELLERYRVAYDDELFRSNFESAVNGEKIDREAEAVTYVQEEIDELVSSRDYQLADNSSKAHFNRQIMDAVLSTDDEEFEFLKFIPTYDE